MNQTLIIRSNTALIFGLSLLLITAGCRREQPNLANPPIALGDHLLDALVLDTVRFEQAEGMITLDGKIAADENKILEVYPTLSGYASQIKVQLGDYVKRGQILAIIHSGEIAAFENQLADARSELTVAQKKLQVEQDLLAGQLATQREVVDARNEVAKAQAAVKQMEDLFRIYKKGDGATYQIIAPISGYIIKKNINNGMEVNRESGESLFTISEINDIWVIGHVFEMDIPKIKEGYKAEIEAISYPNQVFEGRIDRIYNFLDPVTKTMQVRIKIPNHSGLLKPEMYASVRIFYPGSEQKIVIPSSAIIFDNNTNFVLVKRPNQPLRIQEIRIENQVEKKTYITSGLSDGDVIVAQDQLLLYNALLQ